MMWNTIQRTLLVVAFVVIAGPMNLVFADEPEVGQPAPAFELMDNNGQFHKLSDYKGAIVVLHFQSCRCPWDVAYQPILSELAKSFGSQSDSEQPSPVQFLGINANHSEDQAIIENYLVETQMPYPILKDAGNKIADIYAAKTTPHIFVINNDEQQTLAYKGGIEQAPLSPLECGQSLEQYLEPVLKALLVGEKPFVTETASIGCSIKREQN